jgi:hypothetical protein
VCIILFVCIQLTIKTAHTTKTDINYVHVRTKENPNNIEDIHDRKRFRKLQTEGWFAPGSLDIGLVAALDSVALFKRSNVQAWPLWGAIANLSPAERYLVFISLPNNNHTRFKEHNLILLGLWVGTNHPNMHQFLTPITKQLAALEKGTTIHISAENLLLQVILLVFVLDLAAKVTRMFVVYACACTCVCARGCVCVYAGVHYSACMCVITCTYNRLWCKNLVEPVLYLDAHVVLQKQQLLTVVSNTCSTTPMHQNVQKQTAYSLPKWLIHTRHTHPYVVSRVCHLWQFWINLIMLVTALLTAHHLYMHVVCETLTLWFGEEYQVCL